MIIDETPSNGRNWHREMWEQANPAGDEPEKSEMRRALEHAQADAAALWALAEMSTPADILEFGERHKIPALAKHLWQSAFVAGWRAHHMAMVEKTEQQE